jgi:DNA-binding NarL/FixJ family response regulator
MPNDTDLRVAGAAGAGHPAFEASFVGRGPELDRLVSILRETVRTGRPRFLVIEGAPGIGKSRLARELTAAARTSAARSTILQGRCLPGGPGVGNWAPAEMLRRAFGIGSEVSAGELERAFLAGVARSVEPLNLPRREATRTAQALATSAGILLPGNPYDRAEPRDVQFATTQAWGRLFDGLARSGPTLVVLEDIHWAGASLRSIISGVVPSLAGPILHVVTTRPGLREEHPTFLDAADVEWIRLEPLPDDASDAIIADILGGSPPGEEMRSTIIGRAEGNPFFLEETVHHLVEIGALRRDGNGWRAAGDRTSGSLPTSLSSVLAARIDALPLDERQVLQEAAVIGRTFWEGSLRHVLGDARLDALMTGLTERGLISPIVDSSLPGEAEWQFKHGLVRDAAYGTLTARRRARSHAAAGAWLSTLAPGLVDEVAEMVATHEQLAVELDDGGAWDPLERELIRSTAFRHILYAGERARQRSALDRAVEFHEAARRIASTEQERARALASLAQDHEFGLAGMPALELYRQARATARDAGLPDEERARICLGMGRVLALRWGGFPVRQDPAELDEVVAEGLWLANEPESRAWLLALKSAAGLRWSGWGAPDPIPIEERLDASAIALQEATRLRAMNLSGIVLHTRGYLQHDAGRPGEALATLGSLEQLVEQIESPYLRALSSLWLSLAFADLAGDYGRALLHARRSLEIGRTRTPHERLHGTMAVMWCAYNLGDWATVRELLDEHLATLALMEPACCPYLRAGPMVGALAQAHGGDLDRARDIAAQIEPDLSAPGLPEALLARLLVAVGEPAEGERLARIMLDRGRRPSVEENDHETHALVEALLAQEDWAALRNVLPAARERARAMPILGPVCDRAEAMAFLADGSPERAIPLLREAASWFARSHVPFELARTMTLLAPLVPDGDRLLAEALERAEPLMDARVQQAEPMQKPVPSAGAPGELSPREFEILTLVADGRDNDDIAVQLVLSRRTVERHVSNIYLKLGLEGRTARAAAVAWAHRHGADSTSR